MFYLPFPWLAHALRVRFLAALLYCLILTIGSHLDPNGSVGLLFFHTGYTVAHHVQSLSRCLAISCTVSGFPASVAQVLLSASISFFVVPSWSSSVSAETF